MEKVQISGDGVEVRLDNDAGSAMIYDAESPEFSVEREHVQWLLAHGSKKVGVIGFCMGGALTLLAAINVDSVSAAVSFYGVPEAALKEDAKAKVPVQAHFGELDGFKGFSDVDTARALEKRLEAAGVPHEVHIYPSQGHAFVNASPEARKRKEGMGTCCLQRFHSRPQSLHLILAILIILLLRGGILLVALPFRRISLPFGRTANGNKRAHTRRSIHHLLLLPRLVPLPPLFIAPLRPRVLPRGALLALVAVLLRAAVLQRRERQLDVVDARLRVRRRRLHVRDLRRSPHPRKFRLQRAHLPAHLTRLVAASNCAFTPSNSSAAKLFPRAPFSGCAPTPSAASPDALPTQATFWTESMMNIY
ncbi:unnamed protein product [Closterium sp. NIES-53]